VLGALLAGGLLLGRGALPMEEAAAVMGLAAGGVVTYLAVFYGVVLAPGERALVRGLLSRA
jgi:hypothetical protein